MIGSRMHQNYTPWAVTGDAADFNGYHIKTVEGVLYNANSRHRENYVQVKALADLVYDFYIPAVNHPTVGTGIKVIPWQDATLNWPSLAYDIDGSMDGQTWEALPTPIAGVAVTSAPVASHLLLLPFVLYRVRVTGAADTGFFSVISN